MQAGQRSGPRSVAQFERFRCDRNQTEVLVRLPDLLEFPLTFEAGHRLL